MRATRWGRVFSRKRSSRRFDHRVRRRRLERLESSLLQASDPLLALGEVTSSTVTLGWEAIP